MENTILFGDKEVFCIQLGMHSNIEKCKLCFWVKGRKMGSFTKGGELKYSIKAYNIFKTNKESFYNPIFEKMTATQMRKYFVDDLFSLGRSEKLEKKKEYEMRKSFHLFFGQQFTNDGCFIQLLYFKNEVIVIYEPPKKLVADKYHIQYSDFTKVFDEFIEYCHKNHIV